MANGKAGRTSAYETIIEPAFDRIREWAARGESEVKMAKWLGVSYTTWKKHKAEQPSFLAVLKGSREEVVQQIEASMLQSAIGFSKTIVKHYKLRHVEYENGKRLSEHEELVEVEEEVYFPPSFNAARFLLLNWSNYMSEPAAQHQREKEFAHKKKMDENANW